MMMSQRERSQRDRSKREQSKSERSRLSASGELARLRRVLTVAVGAVAIVGLGLLAAFTTLIIDRGEEERFVTELQGRASRAAALVFFDEDVGAWSVEGIIGDAVEESVELLTVIDRESGTVLYGPEGVLGVPALAAAGFDDAAEVGTAGEVVFDGQTMPASAAPYFGLADTVDGAVVVAARQSLDPDQQAITGLVWLAAAILSLLSALAAWLVAGRLLGPVGAGLDREQAFLATAAHELRTPLGRTRAVAESTALTARELPESAERTQLLAELRRLVVVAGESEKSVNDLLLLGRIEADRLEARFEPVRLDRVVAEFEGSVAELAVETTGPVEIMGDPTLVRHGVANLIGNAQRHGRDPDRPLLIEAAVRVVGDRAVVTVSDNGPGIRGVVRSQLFERYETNGSGTGLGLWIVQSIMDAHGGQVEAFDRSPNGADFVLTWPARQ